MTSIRNETLIYIYIYIYMGPIDSIGTVRVGKDWAYGPISSPRIRAYPRTINKGRNKNCFIGKGK